MRSFMELMKSCTKDGKQGTIVPAKVKANLTQAEKELVISTLIIGKNPIIKEFVPEDAASPYSFERLHRMGYNSLSGVGDLTFFHTQTNTPKGAIKSAETKEKLEALFIPVPKQEVLVTGRMLDRGESDRFYGDGNYDTEDRRSMKTKHK